jgi:hypothetical protein
MPYYSIISLFYTNFYRFVQNFPESHIGRLLYRSSFFLGAIPSPLYAHLSSELVLLCKRLWQRVCLGTLRGAVIGWTGSTVMKKPKTDRSTMQQHLGGFEDCNEDLQNRQRQCEYEGCLERSPTHAAAANGQLAVKEPLIVL